ncbi:hypothetical protein [Latilactobacillus sakei]|uniref:hypothetical protein n=1 Tax=Latilactobacillus sakei TaxID=1599 RepID=UPI003F531D15
MKKIVLVIVCIIIFLLGVGVRTHINNKTQGQELQRTEKSIVQKLISEYKGIKKIEFTKASKFGDASDVQF